MERKLRRNILYINLYYFFRSFIFAYVIERLFWRSRGITIAQTVYIEIIYAVTLILMEVPTGILADRFKRKHVIVVSTIINFISAVWMIFAYGFLSFAGIIFLSGIHGALTSGSVTALLYDSLKELNETKLFEKKYALVKGIRYGSGLIAALVGSFVAARYDLVIPYQLSAVSCFMMMVFALKLKEPKVKSEEESMSYKETLIDAKKVVFSNKVIQFSFFIGVLMAGSVNYFEEFWQNYVDGISIDIAYFGLISAAMSGIVLLASRHTSWFVQRYKAKKRNRFYYRVILLSGMCFIGLFWIRHPLGILLMLIPLYFEAILDTMIIGDIHHAVSSEYRATMESIYSMSVSIMIIIFGLAFAWMSNVLEVYGGFMIIGVLCIVALLSCIKYFYKKELIR